MNKLPPLLRKDLETKLIDWGNGSISSEELCRWVDENYSPLHRDVGSNETSQIQLAMHAILNAFDHAKSSDADPLGSSNAIDFLKEPTKDFKKREQEFLRACFKSMR